MKPSSQTILLVDDDPILIQTLGSLLMPFGRILFAMDGAKALAMALSELPDLILLDITMPDLNGYEICARLKADPATAHIPVIFVSARDDEADERMGLEAGAIDYIRKPFSTPIIQNRVKNHLEFKRYGDLLRKLSSMDGLTGLANRRLFEETLTREWKRAMRNCRPISLIILDIDHFKAYNDFYGHLAGDDCLQKVAEALLEVPKRAGDMVARWGGEEFAVIMPETALSGATILAHDLHMAVAALALPHAASPVAAIVTVSVGVSTLLPSGEYSSKDLLQLADKNLYTAKNLGRNRVVT